jgi:hypothetical protein
VEEEREMERGSVLKSEKKRGGGEREIEIEIEKKCEIL